MTMATCNLNSILARTGLRLCLALLINAQVDSSCPGPLAYYNALGCTPVFRNSEDKCAEKYNCDYLKNLRTDQCYVNKKAYNIGEPLKEEDANPCDIGCTCVTDTFGDGTFNCAVVDCFFGAVKPGCFRKRSPLQCCPEEEICPENPKDRATCNVDGKVYKDGEYFEVETDPDLNCICQEGYKGENVEPFCAKPKHPYCEPLFRQGRDVRKNCAPVYYSTQPPQTSCSVFSRCQNANDTVIRKDESDNASNRSDPDMKCIFGNLTMHLGDELNQATDYNSVCQMCLRSTADTNMSTFTRQRV